MIPVSRSTHLLMAVVISGALLCIGLIGSSAFLLNIPHREEVPKVVEIPEGMSLRGLADLLKEKDLITNKTLFILLGKLTSAERRIQPGEYGLNTIMQPLKLLEILKEGRVILHEIRIPEGYTARQIGQLLEEKELLTREAFTRLIHDPDFIRRLGINATSLEGYLFPETYFFSKHVQGEEVIETMVSRFKRAIPPEWSQRARELRLTEHQMVTLASIIEKETRVDDERPLISAVFHNRMKRYIPLQSDPTVIYSLPNFNGNLTRKNLFNASPYNTYRVKGLPPGPIANPGAKSIQAALYPADVNYLYFFSKNDGSHYFSTTLGEHDRAVHYYQPRQPSRHTLKIAEGR